MSDIFTVADLATAPLPVGRYDMLDKALEAVLAPVPPLAMGNIPDTLAVSETVFNVAILPRPRLVLAFGAVIAPVPPLVMANAPPRVIAPVVGVFGVNPVVPPLNVDTPAVPVALMVIVPAPLVIDTPVPAVSVDTE